MREIFETFVQNCKNKYSLSALVTCGQKLKAFSGRCPIRQYIPNKPNPYYGNSENNQNEGPYNFDNCDPTCSKIMGADFNTGRSVTIANWYISDFQVKPCLRKVSQQLE